MNEQEWRLFALQPGRNAIFTSVRPDGRPHAVPVWFDFDGDDIVITSGDATVKAKNVAAGSAVAICIDDQTYPYGFVLIEGDAVIETLSPEDLLPYAIRCAERYVPDGQAEAYGKRNAVEGEILIRVTLNKVLAWKDMSA
ncbi:MAG: PPOX class F420-dependent oxidoreductase [Pseudomonadota bacterium]